MIEVYTGGGAEENTIQALTKLEQMIKVAGTNMGTLERLDVDLTKIREATKDYTTITRDSYLCERYGIEVTSQGDTRHHVTATERSHLRLRG